jgi:hypothetical protein
MAGRGIFRDLILWDLVEQIEQETHQSAGEQAKRNGEEKQLPLPIADPLRTFREEQFSQPFHFACGAFYWLKQGLQVPWQGFCGTPCSFREDLLQNLRGLFV